MKKFTIQEAAELLANKTHTIYCDTNDFEKLRKVLKLAFPEDIHINDYPFSSQSTYGFSTHFDNCWCDSVYHLEKLHKINLSDVLNPTLNEINNMDVIESVTISKEDKSLKVIENNNGWIKIESEDDLPKKEDDYHICIENKDLSIAYFDKSDGWFIACPEITHYQPIIKPQPPIF